VFATMVLLVMVSRPSLVASPPVPLLDEFAENVVRATVVTDPA